MTSSFVAPSPQPERPESIQWLQLVAGLLVVFVALQWTASALGSDRGQAGLLVGLIVVIATLGVERLFFQRSFTASADALGLGFPALRGFLTAMALSVLLLLVIPLFAHVRQASVSLFPGWSWLLFGLFAQAGIAEEILFRGYLFGYLRRRRPFWQAALLAAGPFVVVHLLLFITLPWPIALAALLLAVALSFPFAHLFELGGGTIWPSALVHFVVQGAIKLAVVSGESGLTLPLVWMAASAVLPFLVFLVPRRRSQGSFHAPARVSAE